MPASVSSPTRRRVSPGRDKDAAAVAVAVTVPEEELKAGDEGLAKGASNASGQSRVAFFDAASSEASAGAASGAFDMEGGPAVKVLSPTRTQSAVMQTGGVEICFHELSLTATYMSKRFARKTRKILKGVSGITRKGTCTALMGPSGCVPNACLPGEVALGAGRGW